MTHPPKEIIKFARTFAGTQYKYAVKLEEIGSFFDCSSFTQMVAKKFGKEINRSTILQAALDGEEIPIDHMRLGDFLYYEGDKGHYDKKLFQGRKICVGHVAIYTGNSSAIHAAGGKGVVEESLETIEKNAGPIVIVKRIIE